MIQDWQSNILASIVVFFWVFKMIRYNSFWMYLWQLKNYHIGRFLAHFDTDNGRKIFINPIMLIRIFFFLVTASFVVYENILGYSYSSLPGYAYSPIILFLLILSAFLLMEGVIALRSILTGRMIKPVKTSKILFLVLPVFLPLVIVSFFLLGYFLQGIAGRTPIDVSGALLSAFYLLSFDLLTPLIVSVAILSLQPLTVAMRNKTLYKARFKIETLKKNLLVIGITGSYGKSSTKEFMKIILSESFRVVSTLKNQNSEIGISECILNEVNDSHEVFICEMGAYNKGGVKMLCEIAQPKIGVLVAIGNQHLSTFGSQKNITEAKFELIDSLPKEGLAVLNWDSEYIREGFKGGVASMKCSMKKKEDVWAENIDISPEGISFEACFKNGERIRIKTGILGDYNISNILLCIAVAKKIGMTKEEIANGCSRITPEVSGMGIKDTDYGFRAINSSYSANKSGVLAHFDYFKGLEPGVKKVIVMPCIIELGKEAKQTHYEIGRKAAIACSTLIVTSRDHFEDIKKGASDAGMIEGSVLCIENPDSCLEEIRKRADNGLVLFEGRSNPRLIDKVFGEKNV